MNQIPDYTVVIGVDDAHTSELRLALPNWKKYRPSLFERPWVIFHDVTEGPLSTELRNLVLSYGIENISWAGWPYSNEQGKPITYTGDRTIGRFGNPQREKMLSGFVYVPVTLVATRYWLKLDLDVVATKSEGSKDGWIDPKWFENDPAVIASPWGYSKPPDTVLRLDGWVNSNWSSLQQGFSESKPLNFRPEPGSSLVRHPRITSWCGFFEKGFTLDCMKFAKITCGLGKLPVPSQDGYMWYVAERLGFPINKVRMSQHGWRQCCNEKAMRLALKEIEHA